MRSWVMAAWVLVSCEGCASEAPPPPRPPGVVVAPAATPPPTDGVRGSGGEAGGESSPEIAAAEPALPAEAPPPRVAPPEPWLARAEMAALNERGCHRLLRRRRVPFEAVPAAEAEPVSMPVRLTGPVGGVEVRYRGRRARHAIVDCRLAVSLAGWAPSLRSVGVTRIEHMRAYHPGSRVQATGQRSGHAVGTAIDVSHFVRPDGTLEVERDWADKTQGTAACPPRVEHGEPERILRELVCSAVAADLFQVVVTPNGDERHHNHVHLEIRWDADWTHVR